MDLFQELESYSIDWEGGGHWYRREEVRREGGRTGIEEGRSGGGGVTAGNLEMGGV